MQLILITELLPHIPFSSSSIQKCRPYACNQNPHHSQSRTKRSNTWRFPSIQANFLASRKWKFHILKKSTPLQCHLHSKGLQRVLNVDINKDLVVLLSDLSCSHLRRRRSGCKEEMIHSRWHFSFHCQLLKKNWQFLLT